MEDVNNKYQTWTMKFLRQYWLVFSIFILASALVIVRSFNPDIFRYDAVKWAEPSVLGSNIVSEDQIASLEGEKLLIILENGTTSEKHFQFKTLKIKPGSILERENIRIIRRNKGPVILVADEHSVSAKLWMVLSEMGLKNIYILSDNRENPPL